MEIKTKSTANNFQGFPLLYSMLMGEVWLCGQNFGFTKPFPNLLQAHGVLRKQDAPRGLQFSTTWCQGGSLVGAGEIEGGVTAGQLGLSPNTVLARLSSAV